MLKERIAPCATTPRTTLDSMDKRSGFFLVGSAVLVSIIFVVVSVFRELSPLESTLLQVFSLGLGLIGSYILGKESAKDNARDIIEPHAKSAFRRLVSLTQSLSRLVQTMRIIRPEPGKNPQATAIVDRLEGIVIEQIATAADALEDWRDVLPEDFNALRANPQGNDQAAKE
ncbi:hypothetical protein FQZ97_823290 [compost metagenome]